MFLVLPTNGLHRMAGFKAVDLKISGVGGTLECKDFTSTSIKCCGVRQRGAYRNQQCVMSEDEC